jgi:hypothetical protein
MRGQRPGHHRWSASNATPFLVFPSIWSRKAIGPLRPRDPEACSAASRTPAIFSPSDRHITPPPPGLVGFFRVLSSVLIRSQRVALVCCPIGSLSLPQTRCVRVTPAYRSEFPYRRGYVSLTRIRSARLHEFGQYAAEIGRMQERDRGPHRAVPRPLVDDPDAGGPDHLQRFHHVIDGVADMVNSLTPPRKEPPDRRVIAKWLEQLHVARGTRETRGEYEGTGNPPMLRGQGGMGGRVVPPSVGGSGGIAPPGEAHHRLAHSLLLIGLTAHDGEPKYRLVPCDCLVERSAGYPHVIDPSEHDGYRFR